MSRTRRHCCGHMLLALSTSLCQGGLRIPSNATCFTLLSSEIEVMHCYV